MKKRIRNIAACVMALILAGYESSFARETRPYLEQEVQEVQEEQQNSFLAKCEESSFYFGIKSWATGTTKVIEEQRTIGGELAIGPVVEYRPCNGIGIQTGALYSYNYLFGLDPRIKGKRLQDPGFFKFLPNALDELSKLNQEDKCDVYLNTFKFHALSFPISLRIYPEKTRQFVLYGGVRFIIALSDAKKYTVSHMHVDYDELIEILKQGLNPSTIVKNIFKETSDEPKDQKIDAHLAWDAGFEFNGKSGFVIGINMLGLVLGYDFTRLFLK